MPNWSALPLMGLDDARLNSGGTSNGRRGMRGQVRLAVAVAAGLLAVVGVSGASGSTAPSRWVITDLGVVVGKPYQFSDAAALNETGEVVGESWGVSLDVPNRAFVWERISRPSGSTPRFAWKASPLDSGGLTGDSAAVGMNDSGQVVGYIGSAGNERAAYWDNGVANVIETPLGGWGSWAVDINQHGVIAGSGFPANQITELWKKHGFVWLNGKTTDLGFLPRSNQTQPVALNEHGQVVDRAGPATCGQPPTFARFSGKPARRRRSGHAAGPGVGRSRRHQQRRPCRRLKLER